MADYERVGYVDHFHHRIMQRLLYQDFNPSALSPYSSTHIQQSLRRRYLGCDRRNRGLFHYCFIHALLYLRSPLVVLEGMGLHLEGIMALLRRSMAELLHWDRLCALGYIRNLATPRTAGAH